MQPKTKAKDEEEPVKKTTTTTANSEFQRLASQPTQPFVLGISANCAQCILYASVRKLGHSMNVAAYFIIFVRSISFLFWCFASKLPFEKKKQQQGEEKEEQ